MSYPSPNSITNITNPKSQNSLSNLETGAYRSYNTIYNYYKDPKTNVTDDNTRIEILKNVNNMFGLNSGSNPGSYTKQLPPYNTQLTFSNLVQFYGFWGNNNASKNAITYVQTAKPPQNDTENMENYYNYIATYILFIFFSNPVLNTIDTTENSFKPDINNQQTSPKFTSAIVQLKNFINSSGQSSSLLGGGNFNMVSGEENKGFVYNMCVNDIYQFFNQKNQFLIESGQSLPNDPSIYQNLTDKQISFYRKEISKNPILANWCGCFAPIPKILQDQKTSNFNTQGDSPCDPLCYNRNNFGLYEADPNAAGSTDQDPRRDCVADICVIDNISIESFGETGKINFNQVCTGCKTQNKNCLCFLDVSTPNLVNKIISGPNAMANQINYVQNCPNSICFKIDDTTGAENVVECNRFDIPSSGSLAGNLFADGLSGLEYPQRIGNSIWFVLIIVLFLYIVYQPKIFFNL